MFGDAERCVPIAETCNGISRRHQKLTQLVSELEPIIRHHAKSADASAAIEFLLSTSLGAQVTKALADPDQTESASVTLTQ